MTEKDSPAIVIKDLSFSYDGHPVLEDVNLSIPQGDFVSVVGPNGGGKTTLLKLMLGLLRPSHGEVQVFGVTPEKARPRIGYMPQQVQLDPHSRNSYGRSSDGATRSWLAVRTVFEKG